MKLKIENLVFKGNLVLVEEEALKLPATSIKRTPQAELLERTKLEEKVQLRKGKILTGGHKDRIIAYHKNTADVFDLPVEGYDNLKTINTDYILVFINN